MLSCLWLNYSLPTSGPCSRRPWTGWRRGTCHIHQSRWFPVLILAKRLVNSSFSCMVPVKILVVYYVCLFCVQTKRASCIFFLILKLFEFKWSYSPPPFKPVDRLFNQTPTSFLQNTHLITNTFPLSSPHSSFPYTPFSTILPTPIDRKLSKQRWKFQPKRSNFLAFVVKGLSYKTPALHPVFLSSFASFYDRNREPKPETELNPEPRARRRFRFRFLLGQNDQVLAVPVLQHWWILDIALQ
jgi:hypothetical protein